MRCGGVGVLALLALSCGEVAHNHGAGAAGAGGDDAAAGAPSATTFRILPPLLPATLPEGASPTDRLFGGFFAGFASADGSLLVGSSTYSYSPPSGERFSGSNNTAWSDQNGTMPLPGGSQRTCVAPDGSWVVGSIDNNGQPSNRRARS